MVEKIPTILYWKQQTCVASVSLWSKTGFQILRKGMQNLDVSSPWQSEVQLHTLETDNHQLILRHLTESLLVIELEWAEAYRLEEAIAEGNQLW